MSKKNKNNDKSTDWNWTADCTDPCSYSYYSYADSETVTVSTAFSTDRTPTDPVEEAELKLAGICPKCRATLPEHEWDCADNSVWTGVDTFTVTDSTIGMNYDNYITIDPEPKLSPETTRKLNKIFEELNDNDIDDLIKKLGKLKDL